MYLRDLRHAIDSADIVVVLILRVVSGVDMIWLGRSHTGSSIGQKKSFFVQHQESYMTPSPGIKISSLQVKSASET